MLTLTHRSWLRAPSLVFPAFVAVLLASQNTFPQGLFWESARVLPGNITRVEYANLEVLRKMPHFASLRRAYTGALLSDSERWLGVFGLNEESIREFLLGLEEGKEKGGAHTFAIAAGELRPTLPTEAGYPTSPLARTEFGDLTGYCQAPASDGLASSSAASSPYALAYRAPAPCGLFNGQSWAALGTKEFLSYVVEGGNGLTEPLSSEPQFMDLVAIVPRDAPLWGAARGAAAMAWFKAVIPFANSMPIVWSSALDGLDGLAYSVTPGEDQIRVTVSLQYRTSSGASWLGAVLQGVKVIEGALWRTQHPVDLNPFSDIEVRVDDRTVFLAMSPSYQALESGLVLGPAHGK